MNEEIMRKYIEEWFDKGYTLKDLIEIIIEIIPSKDYKDH